MRRERLVRGHVEQELRGVRDVRCHVRDGARLARERFARERGMDRVHRRRGPVGRVHRWVGKNKRRGDGLGRP